MKKLLICAGAAVVASGTAGFAFHRAHRQDQGIVPDDYRKMVQQIAAQSGEEQYPSIAQLDQIGRTEMKKKGIYPKLVRGNPKLKTVALTFDDGPYPDATPKLLKVLKDEGVTATMFNIGYKVEKYPELLHAEMAAHMEIGNHTFAHIPLGGQTPKIDENELVFGAKTIQKAGNMAKEPDICRTRGGGYDDTVVAAARRHHYTMALWTDDPGDWTGMKADKIEHILIRDLNPGGIVLLHDNTPETLKALPVFIREAKRRGYTFVTCGEMMKQPGCVTWGGPNTYAEKKTSATGASTAR